MFCGGMLALGLASVSHADPTARRPDSMKTEAGQSATEQRKQKDAVCTKCHDESETRPILAIYQTKHGAIGDARTPGCRDCHGASEKHLGGNLEGTGRPRPDRIFGSKSTTAGYEPSDPQEQSEICLSCHKSGLRMRWSGSQHQTNDVACASCHTVHTQKDPVMAKIKQPAVCFTCHQEKRAEIKKISTHPIDAGKLTCSECHNPHGSTGPKLLARNTVNETCFECHAEKRGPFLWEHQPVNEDCTNCHTPHGSNITPLLKSRPPFLCQECHDGPHDSKTPYGPGGLASATANTANRVAGRGCLNCHAQVHGSNSPVLPDGRRLWQ